MLGTATLSAWAKSDREGGSLSLVRHLADSGEVAKLVWDRWLPAHTRQRISVGLPGGEADGRTLLVWLAATHDIGKLTPAFACQVPELADAMHDRGLRMPDALGDRKALPHSLAGEVTVLEFLTGLGWDREVAKTYAVVAGSHHGVPPTVREVRNAPARTTLFGEGQWSRSRDELLRFVTERTGAWELLERLRRIPLTVTQQSLLTAAVIVTDWIASNQDLFPLDEARVSSTAAPAVWELLGLPHPWQPSASELHDDPSQRRFFCDRFGWPPSIHPRPLQLECLRVADVTPVPGLMVVEAPMGEGKTEAALAAAEILAQRFGLGGIFVALPTMATSDAMFARVRKWAENLPVPPAAMFLAHGKAALNAEFTSLHRRGFDSIGTDCADSGVVAHAWFVGKKGPLANVVVGTIDQILRAALKTRHLMLRHLALANKVVVIDEVHAADSYMSTYLCRSLEWLAAYRVPVILLSATLPPSQREALVLAYARGYGTGDDEVCLTDHGYPAITHWPNPELSTTVAASGRSIAGIEIAHVADDLDVLAERVREALADGGIAGVVCNTVARAQETYLALEQAGFPEDELLLIHSRFVASHRAELEARLRAMLGPPGGGTVRPDRLVVVGTQVIEQSLDIDLDLLITDLAPMDLLLQRIGRLHRHDRPARPPKLVRPSCWVRGADWNEEPPQPVRGSQAVYGLARLLRCAAVLRRRAALTVPDDVPGLVADAYREQLEVPTDWLDAYHLAEKQWHEHVDRQREKARTYLLSAPYGDNRTLHGWVATGIPDDADGVGGQAQVRDAEDTIEAIVVQRCGDHVRALPQVPEIGGTTVPTDAEPPVWLAKKLAACTIRLPAMLTRYGHSGTVIRALEDTWYPGWQRVHWLAGELVLELDEQCTAELAGHHLEYDTRLGLLVAPVKEGK